jgi:hypothetical protein
VLFRACIIDGQTVILNREGGQLHQLNTTASFIWACCDGTMKFSDMVSRLVEIYDIDSVTAHEDVEEVLSKLQDSNLLERAKNNSKC